MALPYRCSNDHQMALLSQHIIMTKPPTSGALTDTKLPVTASNVGTTVMQGCRVASGRWQLGPPEQKSWLCRPVNFSMSVPLNATKIAVMKGANPHGRAGILTLDS